MQIKKGFISVVKKILVSMLVAIVVTGVLLLITSYLIMESLIGEAQVGTVLVVIHTIASFIAGMMIGKIQRERKYMWGVIAGICWFVFVLILSALMQETGIDMNELSKVLLASIIGGIAGGMLA